MDLQKYLQIRLAGAALVAIGGTMGFLKTGSVTSLATAVIFAVLVAFSAFRLSQRDQKAPTLLKSKQLHEKYVFNATST